MTKNIIKLLDVVALTVNLSKYNLYRGQVGTGVELLANGTAFEVEFSDACGGLRLRMLHIYHQAIACP
ncbi:MAG: DUF4926 domain-containing protein [Nostoc sp.]|uniref:DUF4926 domain-containing protein n=1 Tax=Nostoc sp. TaxID=1180 RepID=UPI002FF4725B